MMWWRFIAHSDCLSPLVSVHMSSGKADSKNMQKSTSRCRAGSDSQGQTLFAVCIILKSKLSIAAPQQAVPVVHIWKAFHLKHQQEVPSL